MANFLEDFIGTVADNVTPDPNTGFATFMDNIWPDENNYVGQAIASPLLLPSYLLRGGVSAVTFIDDVLSRPASFALQASTYSNPLYRDGVSIDDFRQMWNASAYLSPGRAAMTNLFSPGNQFGTVVNMAFGNEGNWNNLSYSPGSTYNPYLMGEQATEAAWDNSTLGTIGSGATDIAWQFAAGKGIGAAASVVKRAAGLATSINGMRDLQKLNNTLTDHVRYVQTEGTEGKFSELGTGIIDIANTKDYWKIYSSSWLTRMTSAGSRNRMGLSRLLSEVDDPYLVKDILLADRGDYAAIGRLMQQAPNHVWTMTDMSASMRAKFIEGGQYYPTPEEAGLIRQVFDSELARDDFYSAVKGLFLNTGEDGLISNVARGADFIPMQGVAGRAQKWLYNAEMATRIGEGGRYVDMPLGVLGSGKPVTTLLQWVGGRRPLNRVSLSGLRPDEVADEMLYYSSSSRALRGNPFLEMPVIRPDGSQGLETITMAQWRNQAIGRLGDAKLRGGDTAVAEEVRKLENELVAAIANRYRIDPETRDAIISGLQEARDKSQRSVVRDGFFYDETRDLVVVDPKTRRQLADELVLLPLDELDAALRVESTTTFARRGRAVAGAIDTVEPALDFVLRFWRTNMLFKPGYTPKNSLLEPAISSLLAHGTILSPDGVMEAISNFTINRGRQIRQAGYAVSDRLGISGLRRQSNEILELHRQREFLRHELEHENLFIDSLDSAGVSPATAAAYRTTAYESRKALDRQLADIESVLDELDPGFRAVREVPTLTELSRRLDDIDAAISGDPRWAAGLQTQIDDIYTTAQGRSVSTLDEIDSQLSSLRTRRDELKKEWDIQRQAYETDDVLTATRGQATAEQRLAGIEDELSGLRTERTQLRERLASLDPESRDFDIVNGQIASVQRRIRVLARRRASGKVRKEYESETRLGGGPADMTRPKTTAKGRDYRGTALRRQMESLQRQIDGLELKRSRYVEDSTGYVPAVLTSAEKAQIRSLQRQRAMWERGQADDGKLSSRLEELKAQREAIREEMSVLEPTALDRKLDLEQKLDALDAEIGIKGERLVEKRLKREQARERKLGGEGPVVITVGDDQFSIAGVYDEGNFGAAMRAEASSGQTNALTFDPSEWGASASNRWARAGGVGVVQPTDPGYWTELAYIANRQIRGDQMAELILRGVPPQDIMKWLRTPAGKRYARGMGWTNDNLYSRVVGRRKASLQYEERTASPARDVRQPGTPSTRPGYKAAIGAAQRKVAEAEDAVRAAKKSGQGLDEAEAALQAARYEVGRLRVASENSGAPRVEQGPEYFDAGVDTPAMREPMIPLVQESTIAENIRLMYQYFPDPEVRARLLDDADVTPAELQKLMGLRDDLSPVHSGALSFQNKGKVTRAINNALNTIWRNLATKPEDRFGRFPYFDRQWRTNVQADARLLREQGQELTVDVVNNLRAAAASRALKDLENTFYNIRRYSNPVYALRYLVGFPGAYFNSLYRYGRLAYRNPGRAFIGANMYSGAYQTFGVDENGERTQDWTKVKNLVIPVPEEVQKVIPIDPQVTLSTRTVDYISSAPTFLPIVTMPVSSVLRYKPTANEWIKKEMGDDFYRTMFPFNQPSVDNQIKAGPLVLDPMFAGWELDLITALNPTDEDFIQAADQIYLFELSEWERTGKTGKPPSFEDAAKSARNFWFGKSFFKFLGMSGLGAQPQGQMWRDEWLRFKQMYPGDTQGARQAFIDQHGEAYKYFTYSTSDYRVYMPSNTNAYNRLQEHGDLANSLREINPDDPALASIMFWGADGEFDRAIYNWMAENSLPGDDQPLRSKLDPAEIQDRQAAEQSWAMYNASVAKRDAMMMQYGYTSLSPDGESAWLYRQWHDWTNSFILDPANKQWYAQFTGGNFGKANQTLQALATVLSSEQFMNTFNSVPAYQVATTYLQNREIALRAFDDAADSDARKAIQTQWDTWVTRNILPSSSEFASLYVRNLQGEDLG